MNPTCHCPGYTGSLTDPPEVTWYGSYSYNTSGVAQDALLGLSPSFNSVSNTTGPFCLEGQVVAPSETFAIMDTVEDSSYPTANSGTDWTCCVGQSSLLREKSSGRPPSYPYPTQHGNNSNVGFCDGHIDAVPFTALFNPAKTAQNWNVDHQSHPEFW